MHIALVGCSRAKDPDPELLPARERYTSPLFRKSLAFAQLHADHVGIVSAKHGFLMTDHLIGPYNQRLRPDNAEAWARETIGEMAGIYGEPDIVMILAGAEYAGPLEAELVGRWPDVVVHQPLAGMQIGERLAFLAEHEKVCTKIPRPCALERRP